jgi:uncharacterized membrane protein
MNDTRNPYSPPDARVEDLSLQPNDAEPLIENGRRVPVGHCSRWIGEAHELFSQRPAQWIGTMLLLALISMVVSLVPFSNLFTTLLWPVVAGGIAYALDRQRQTRSFTLSAVFAGFSQKFLPLAAVGFVTLVSYAIFFVIFAVTLGSDFAIAMMGGARQKLGAVPPGFWSALILSMVVAIPLTAATFLAAPLIVLHEARPLAAMKMSFFGCMKNIVPWILSGILMMLLILVSMIPLLLGLFVTLPMAVMLFYSMYRDIFIDSMGAEGGPTARKA